MAARPPKGVKNQHKIYPYQSIKKQTQIDQELTKQGTINDPARDTGGFEKIIYDKKVDDEGLLFPS